MTTPASYGVSASFAWPNAAKHEHAPALRRGGRAAIGGLMRRLCANRQRCCVKSYGGAPRPMKMGTTASPCRYDSAARHALQSGNPRRPAILRYATWEAASRFRGMSGYPSIAALSVDPRIDAMRQNRSSTCSLG